jgi:hypothetical protein
MTSYPTINTGAGSRTLTLLISQNAWSNKDNISDVNGDAEFQVFVNGVQQGGTFTALAPHATSDGTTVTTNPGEQTFNFMGNFGQTANVLIKFINDAWGGTPTTDRNLYVDGVSYDGANQHEAATLLGNGSAQLLVASPQTPVSYGTGPDTVSLQISENAWANHDSISDGNGDAEFTVTINGVKQGGTFTATTAHGSGDQIFKFLGTFGASPSVQVTFINDAWGGTPQTDRNLYVDGMSYDGVNQNQSKTFFSNGTGTFNLTAGGSSGGTGTGVRAVRAADVTGTLNVDTHLEAGYGGYGNPSTVATDMQYLGVHAVRTGTAGMNGGGYGSNLNSLASNGVKFDFILNGVRSTTDLNNTIANLRVFAQAHPIAGIEGPNEINNFPITYNGFSGEAAAYHLQADTYAAVKADPTLQKIPVYFYTGYQFDSNFTSPTLNTSASGLYNPALADYDNQHPYPRNGATPAGTVARTATFTNTNNPTAIPGVYTEEGYNTKGIFNNGTNVKLLGNYELDMIMDGAKQGIKAQYLYELLDGGDGWGLFTNNGQTPTQIAVDVHNLTQILQDTASNAMSFTTGSDNVTLSGLPSSGNQMLLQKADGTFDLVVWNEPGINRPLPSALPINIDLGANFNNVSVFDPTQGTAPIQTYSATRTLTINVNDHPVIVAFHN